MLTEMQARHFAQEWINGWNSHNLEAILSHYHDEVILTSPVAVKLLQNPDVVGKEGLRRYFALALETFPDLKFELLEITLGVSSVVLYYRNQHGRRTCEVMEMNDDLKAVRIIAHYSI